MLKKILIGLVFSILFWLFIPNTASAVTGPIFGMVKDSQLRPLANIEVKAYCAPATTPPSPTPPATYPSTATATTKTESNGVYGFRFMGERWCKFAAGSTYVVTFINKPSQMNPGPIWIKDLILNSISPISLGRIQGYVYDSSWNKIGNAEIKNTANNSVIGISSPYTDTLGYFLTEELPVGTYILTAEKPGYIIKETVTVTVTAGGVISWVPPPYLQLKTAVESANFGQVEGYVKNQQGQGIDQAQIRYSVDNTTYTIYTSNTNLGYYLTSDIPADRTISVTAFKSGYDSQTQQVDIIGGQKVRLDFTLNIPSGKIEGKVVENTQNGEVGVGEAIVKNAQTGAQLAITASNGSYTISDLPAGTYHLKAEKAGYLSSPSTSITVSAGQPATASNLILSRPGSISGLIKDTSQNPVAGATISTSFLGQIVTSTSNSDGGYNLTNLPSGSFTISASHTDFHQASLPAVLYSSQQLQLDFTLSPLPFGKIEGNVKDSMGSGNPLEGAQIFLDGNNTNILTDSNGHYLLERILEGNHTITAAKENYRLENTINLNAIAGLTVQAPDLILIGQGGVEGFTYVRTFTADGERNDAILPSVDIYLNGVKKTTSDASGHYIIEGVDEGDEYGLKGVKEGYQERIMPIIIYTGRLNRMDLVLLNSHSSRIEGNVYSVENIPQFQGEGPPDFQPLKNAKVIVYRRGLTAGVYYTDENGYFISDLLMLGQYKIKAKKDGSAEKEEIINVVANQIIRQDFHLISAPGEAYGNVYSNIDVQGISNIAIGDATIKLTGTTTAGRAVSQETKTDGEEDGRYTFENLPFGNYQLEVSHPEYQPARSVIEIIANNPRICKIFDLIPLPQAKGSIAGKVFFDNQPEFTIMDVKVSVFQGTTLSGHTFTNYFGNFYGCNDGILLTPGSYQIEAEKNGYNKAAENIVINPGANTMVNLALSSSQSAILEGKVNRNNGSDELIKNAQVDLYKAGQVVSSTSTNDEGGYSLAAPLGNYQLQVSHQDYHLFQEEITLNAGFNLRTISLKVLEECQQKDNITFCFQKKKGLALMADASLSAKWAQITFEIWRLRNKTGLVNLPSKVIIEPLINASGRANSPAYYFTFSIDTNLVIWNEDWLNEVVRHEWGHLYDFIASPYRSQDEKWQDLYRQAKSEVNGIEPCNSISSYSCKNTLEFFAESFEQFYSDNKNPTLRDKINRSTSQMKEVLKEVYNYLWNLPELKDDYPGPIAYLKRFLTQLAKGAQ